MGFFKIDNSSYNPNFFILGKAKVSTYIINKKILREAPAYKNAQCNQIGFGICHPHENFCPISLINVGVVQYGVMSNFYANFLDDS